MNWDWLKFKPLGEGWTMYCLGLSMGILTTTGYDWEKAITTGIAVYVVLSVLKWVLVGGKE